MIEIHGNVLGIWSEMTESCGDWIVYFAVMVVDVLNTEVSFVLNFTMIEKLLWEWL